MTKIFPSTEKTIWISWEMHRRTTELAKAFGSNLYIYKCDSSTNILIRYLRSSYFTLKTIYNKRPKILFVQNPSLVLASLACFLKIIFKYKLVVDRHTNFWLDAGNSIHPTVLIFKLLSNYSLKNADLTIVTNEYLKDVVEKKNGRGFVLTDRLPEIQNKSARKLDGRLNIVFISTFSKDEPFMEVFNAAKLIDEDIFIYVTGNYKKIFNEIPIDIPPNLVLTGFLEEQDFIDLLFSADAIMDFTTADWTLVCGGYEAISAGKPFITSDKKVLRSYFNKGAIFTENIASGISNAIFYFNNNRHVYKQEIDQIKNEKHIEWSKQFNHLTDLIGLDR